MTAIEVLVTSSSALMLMLVIHQFGQMFNWFFQTLKLPPGGFNVWKINNLIYELNLDFKI